MLKVRSCITSSPHLLKRFLTSSRDFFMFLCLSTLPRRNMFSTLHPEILGTDNSDQNADFLYEIDLSEIDHSDKIKKNYANKDVVTNITSDSIGSIDEEEEVVEEDANLLLLHKLNEEAINGHATQLPISVVCGKERLIYILKELKTEWMFRLISSFIVFIISCILFVSTLVVYINFKEACLSVKQIGDKTLLLVAFFTVFHFCTSFCAMTNWQHISNLYKTKTICKNRSFRKVCRKMMSKREKYFYSLLEKDGSVANMKNFNCILKVGEAIYKQRCINQTLHDIRRYNCKTNMTCMKAQDMENVIQTMKQTLNNSKLPNFQLGKNPCLKSSTYMYLYIFLYVAPVLAIFVWSIFSNQESNVIDNSFITTNKDSCAIPFIYFWIEIGFITLSCIPLIIIGIMHFLNKNVEITKRVN